MCAFPVKSWRKWQSRAIIVRCFIQCLSKCLSVYLRAPCGITVEMMLVMPTRNYYFIHLNLSKIFKDYDYNLKN